MKNEDSEKNISGQSIKEPYKSGIIEEIRIRFCNLECPKITRKIMASKQSCVSDYSCCGQIP